MTKLIVYFTLLFSINLIAQDTITKPQLSIISLDKVKVVYRGIDNPITVAVTNAKSYTVSGPSVFLNKDETYSIRPGVGLETKVYVEIILEDDSFVVEEHIYQIKNLPRLTGTFNDDFSTQGILYFRKEDLKDGIVGIKMIDFTFNIRFETISFSLLDENNNELFIEGNKINDEGFNFIKKLKRKSTFFIKNIKYPVSPQVCFPMKVNEIVINLTD